MAARNKADDCSDDVLPGGTDLQGKSPNGILLAGANGNAAGMC